jgi:hypothetical protein
MSTTDNAPIVCAGCSRKFAWKVELSGKRVRCKCGQEIVVRRGAGVGGEQHGKPKAAVATAKPKAVVPTPVGNAVIAPVRKAVKPAPKPAEPDGFDALLALSQDAERAAAEMPVEVREVDLTAAPAPVRRAKTTASGIPLAYRRGPSAVERQKAAAAVGALTDPVRDLYVPIGLLVTGFLLYTGFYGFNFHLGIDVLPVVGFGLLIITVFKTALLVGAALVMAGPLGVGFGQLWHAVLKLAAIAVVTDGVTAWVDAGIQHVSGGVGGGGAFGYGIIGWPVSLGLYWGLMIYLFSMDPGDSWLVVICLSFLSRILRILIVMFVLQMILGWGGVSDKTAAAAGMGNGPAGKSSVHASLLSTHVDEQKEAGNLLDARKYIADGNQAVAAKSVEAWYAAGCPNVWYEMSSPDINGRRTAGQLLIEFPKTASKRAKVYEILKQYYKDEQIDSDPSDFKDSGEDYLPAPMRVSN